MVSALGLSRQAGDPGSLSACLVAEKSHYFTAPGVGFYKGGNLHEALLA